MTKLTRDECKIVTKLLQAYTKAGYVSSWEKMM